MALGLYADAGLSTSVQSGLTSLMTREILVNVTPNEIRIALVDNGILQEIHIERHVQQGLLGNIYKGRVRRLLPGIQAAFIDIGLERPGFLHIADMQRDTDSTDIRHYLAKGQEVLVQVYKDTLGSKGARLTTQFSIPSRYLVLTPYVKQIVVSHKITDEAEKERLLNLITPSAVGGYIFRTAAVGVSAAEIQADQEFLNKRWIEIMAQSRQVKRGHIVHEEIPLILRILRDLVGDSVERIRVDSKTLVLEMREFAQRYLTNFAERIEYYYEKQPIFDIYRLDEEIQKAIQRNVYLKSGGHVVFDQTEAMTTVDVNTGSYLGQDTLEQTILKTNLEAAIVIARQVRLRNLGGIIIIDFIDMIDSAHKEHLLTVLTTELAKDSTKTQISELSSLGLVQMTRKRTHESLEHILCVPCSLCHRRGSIKSLETMYYEIFRELKRAEQRYPWSGFLVMAARDVIAGLLTEESAMIADLAEQFGKPIKLQEEISYGREQYEILPVS
jgi:ribonuclease G